MAPEADRLVAGTGWLPALLRTANSITQPGGAMDVMAGTEHSMFVMMISEIEREDTGFGFYAIAAE